MTKILATRKMILVTALSMVLILAGSMTAYARSQMGHGYGPKKMAHKKTLVDKYFILKKLQDKLQLTDSQLAGIKTIVFNTEEKMVALKAENMKLMLELKKMLDVDTVDYAAVEQVVSKKFNNKAMMFMEHLKAKKAIEKSLTAEQLDMIKEMKKAWMKKIHKKRGYGHGYRERMMRREGSPAPRSPSY